MVTRHVVEWRTAAPLWDPARPTREGPALLRFTDERFMEDFAAALPAGLAARQVPRKETWRDAGVVWADHPDELRSETARLYQPVHGRFYLAAGSLVCRQPGLPDRAVKPGEEERAFFVLRRLVAEAGGPVTIPGVSGAFREHAWRASSWSPVVDGATFAEGEQQHPLFPSAYTIEGRRRTLHVGFVPVSSRETFQAAPAVSPIGGSAAELASDPLADVRAELFTARVSGALSLLGTQYAFTANGNADEEVSEALLFVLLDLRDLLAQYYPRVRAALSGGPIAAGSPPTEVQLLAALNGTTFTAGRSWAQAVLAAEGLESALLAGTLDVAGNALTGGLGRAGVGGVVTRFTSSAIAARFAAANSASTPPPLSSAPVAVPKYDPDPGTLYVIRFVYDRARCRGIHPPVVSSPSRAFSLAPYFDPDAPVRPLHISLPVDTSIKGLRKYPRAVSFLISNQLRAQIQRVQNIKLADLDEGTMGPPGEVNLGMICSFSIPIITIAALLLLMIIVSLMNIVFWWLPFLRICLPLRLKAS